MLLRAIERVDNWTTPATNFGQSCYKLIAGAIIGHAFFKNIEGMLICAPVSYLMNDRPRTMVISALGFAALKMGTEHYLFRAPFSSLSAFAVSVLGSDPNIGGMLLGTGFWGLGIKYALFPAITWVIQNRLAEFLALSQLGFGVAIGRLLPRAIVLPSREKVLKLTFCSLIATTIAVTSYYFNDFNNNARILGGFTLLSGMLEGNNLLFLRLNPPDAAQVADLPPPEPARQEEEPFDRGGPAPRPCSPQSMVRREQPSLAEFQAAREHYPNIGELSFEKGVPIELQKDRVFCLAECSISNNRIFDFALDPNDFELYESSFLEFSVRQHGRSPRSSQVLSVDKIIKLKVLNEVMIERAEFYRKKLLAGCSIAQLLQTPPEHSAEIRAALNVLERDIRFEGICRKLRAILESIDDPLDWEWAEGQIPPKLYDDCLFSLFICEHSKKPICTFVADGDLLYEETEVKHSDKKFEPLNALTALVKHRMKGYKTLILENASKEEIERFKRIPPNAQVLNGVLGALKERYFKSVIWQKLQSLLPDGGN